MQEFIDACTRIESDVNFQSYITNNRLMRLVVTERGNPMHIPVRSALVIQHSEVSPQSEDGESLGKVYQIKIARKGIPAWDECDGYPEWHIDTSLVILVNLNGECSLHAQEHALAGNFNSPLAHLDVNNYLNQANSLVFEVTQNQIAEVRKNARVFVCEVNNPTTLFSRLPTNVLATIAEKTADNEVIPDRVAAKIVNRVFNP